MDIIGHKKILALFDKTIAKNAVSQAYLFLGPEQVGKFTVALDFAEKITKIKEDVFIVRPEIESGKKRAANTNFLLSSDH